MADNDPQKIWDDYYDRVKNRRKAEASLLWAEIEAAGMTTETVFALDFTHFSTNREDADALATQLSENYAVEVSARDEPNYWDIKGTTRPDGIYLTKDQHIEWVEFMSDVSHSYACVFSDWTLETPAHAKIFRSASVDDE